MEQTIHNDESLTFRLLCRYVLLFARLWLPVPFVSSAWENRCTAKSTHLLPRAELLEDGWFWFGVKDSKSPKGSAFANVLPGRPNGLACVGMKYVACETLNTEW